MPEFLYLPEKNDNSQNLHDTCPKNARTQILYNNCPTVFSRFFWGGGKRGYVLPTSPTPKTMIDTTSRTPAVIAPEKAADQGLRRNVVHDAANTIPDK